MGVWILKILLFLPDIFKQRLILIHAVHLGVRENTAYRGMNVVFARYPNRCTKKSEVPDILKSEREKRAARERQVVVVDTVLSLRPI